MRPVARGNAPVAAFARYRDAALPLIDRLGSYCCYCERHLETHVAVEHVSPKSLVAALMVTWENLLLSCVNCNSSKGAEPIEIDNYLWPDRDNTLLALKYREGLVTANESLVPAIRAKVQALIILVGLDKDPGNPARGRSPQATDRRWKARQDIWDLAQRTLRRLHEHDSPQLRDQIVDTALSRGGFGIWFTVFARDADMCQRLATAFPGTALNCFADGALVQRPDGQL